LGEHSAQLHVVASQHRATFLLVSFPQLEFLFFSFFTFLRLTTGRTVRGSNADGARFPAPVQTGPGTHSASYTMDTGSFPGVKRPGRGVDHPPLSSAEVKETVELYFTPILCLRALF